MSFEWFGNRPGFGNRRGISVVAPTLNALTGTFALAEDAAGGDVAGALSGKTGGSTLSLVDDAGGRVALSGSQVVRGATALDYETATSHSFTVRETLAGATNTPRDTVLSLAVTNVFEAATLSALSLSATTFTTGTPSSGSITGDSTGSTITASGLPSGLTINGAARTWAWDGTGSASTGSITLTETLADSSNSPRATAIGFTIVASATAAPVLSDQDGWTTGDNPPVWDATYDGWVPYDSGTGHRVRAVWTFNGDTTTEAWQGLDLTHTLDGFTWPLLAAADLSAGGSFSVYEEMDYVVGDVEQAISAHSNTWGDTLGTTIAPETPAVWNGTTGVNKRSNITVSGSPALVATGASGFNNAPISVRATEHRAGKRQFQLTRSNRTASAVHIGVDDGTDNFNDTDWSRPGRNNSSGVTCRFVGAATGWMIGVGGAQVQSGVFAGTPISANGDILTCVFDTVAGTVSFYWTQSGVTQQIGTTVTGVSLSNWYANCGFENTDTQTALFGTGQARTLDTGYVTYDN